MPNEEQSTAAFCPNCQKPAIRIGNEITCDRCDAIFIITKKQGAKLKELGPIQDINNRIKRLENSVFNAGPPDNQSQETDDNDEDDEI